MIMNKKVSTLVAALMAAGALVLPKDVFAQVQYANGGYADAPAISKISNGSYYLVFHEGDKDYVAVVDDSKLKAVELDEADPANVQIKLTKSASNWIISSLTGDELNTNSAGANWATPTKDTNNLWTISADKNEETVTIKAAVENGKTLILSSSVAGELSFASKGTPTISSAKLVKVDEANPLIEAQENATTAITAGSSLDLSKGYVLFRGDQVLEGQKGGTAAWADYDKENQAQIWTINVIDDQTGEARFVNSETGELLRQADGTTPVTITLGGDKNGWEVPTNLGIESLIEDGVTVTISFGETQEIGVNGSELNEHFNGKGFNFTADKELANVDVDGDLFGGDTRVFAFTLNRDYSLTTTNNNGQKLTIPKGTYFFADPVFLNGMGAAEVDASRDADNIDWLNSTLIAVSSTTASEATDSDRRNGEGFDLVTVKGSEFDFQSNNEKPQGDDLSIQNACFTVTKDYNSKYALEATIYYQKESDYKATDEQTPKAIHLAVESYGKTTQRLVSQVGAKDYVFSLASTSVQDGRLLLNDSKTAAVYTIQIVEGPKGYEEFEGKYLTVGNKYVNGTADFQWEAKGTAIYEESFPAFQFVISDVNDYDKASKKYQTVVFTNRETGEPFETMLFPEGESMQFSLSTDDLTNVVPYTIKTTAQNTYQVEPETAKTITSDVIVELKKVDVDQYAGFYDVEDGTIRTLSFARDKNDTSNKLYASVEVDENDNYKLNEEDEFATDIADAAQWKLMKVDSAQISRVFAYNKSATESVDYVADGDKLTAYRYALRYVENGTETDYFLKDNYSYISSPTIERNLQKVEGIEESKDLEDNNAFNTIGFIIKENADGSISLIDASNAFLYYNPLRRVVVAGPDERKIVEVDYEKKNNEYHYDYILCSEPVYWSTSETNNIRTFLDAEYSEISWPANEGHVTLLSEMDNYITKNSDNDAIEVAETEPNVYYLHVTDKDAVVPSFYISLGAKENSSAEVERLYMFNPVDSVDYYVADGTYDKKYQWSEEETKLIFKYATMGESRDTLTTTIKGEEKQVAMKADDDSKNILGGLQRFKYQIVETEDGDSYYYIRQLKGVDGKTAYLTSRNSKMTFTNDKTKAMKFHIESVAAPTANEAISATDVKVVALDGAVNVKNAAGKNVVVSTILGQIVANEVLTSDNATISVPAGIAIVSVDGEEAVKVSVK